MAKFKSTFKSVHNTPKSVAPTFDDCPGGLRLALQPSIHRLQTPQREFVNVKGSLPRRQVAIQRLISGLPPKPPTGGVPPLAAAILLLALLLPSTMACFPFKSYAISPLNHRICAPQRILCADTLHQATCDAVSRAVDYWNAATRAELLTYGGRGPFAVSLNEIDTSTVTIGPLPRGAMSKSGRAAFAALTMYGVDKRTFCLRAAGTVVIITPDTATSEALESVIRHELGHILGLLDTDDPRGLMYEAIDPTEHELRTLSTPEMNALHALYGIF